MSPLPKSYQERVRDYEDSKEEKLKQAEELVTKFKHEKYVHALSIVENLN